jgi:hypothetical protein
MRDEEKTKDKQNYRRPEISSNNFNHMLLSSLIPHPSSLLNPSSLQTPCVAFAYR